MRHQAIQRRSISLTAASFEVSEIGRKNRYNKLGGKFAGYSPTSRLKKFQRRFQMARGGQRDGAGRKRGIPNRFAKANIEKAEKTGILPVDYMLAVMRNSNAGNDRRDAMARAAAPYLHPRLATVEYKAESFDLSKLTDEELEQLYKMQLRLQALQTPGMV